MNSKYFALKIKLALGVGMLLVALVGIAAYGAIDQLVQSERDRVQGENTVTQIERTALSLRSAEAALRQYLLTGEITDLAKFQRARLRVREAVNELKPLRLPEQALLESLLTDRRAINDEAILKRQDNDADAAAAVLGGTTLRQLIERTDSVFDQLRTRENQLWRNAKTSAEKDARWAQQLIIAGGVLFLGMLVWVMFVVQHYEKVRKRVEGQLRDSEAMSRTINENMADGVITTTTDDIILEANAAAQKLFGYDKSELIGRDVSTLVPQRHRQKYKDVTRGLKENRAIGETVGREVRSLRKDGTEFTASVSFGASEVGGRRLFTALIHDITASKATTEALRASEAQLRQITDTVPALIAYLDDQERFSFHNKAYEELLGLSFDQIHGHTLAEVLGQAAYDRVQDKVKEVLAGYAVRYERVQETGDGQLKNYSMSYFPRYGEGHQESKVIGFFSLGSDITELRRIDRMKTEFVSTVSHELRTPLTSIRGSLGLIAGGVGGELPETVKNLVGIAKNNCERLIRLINDILDSEKIESGKMQLELATLDIRPVLQNALVTNEGFAAQHRVTLQLHAPDEPLMVSVDSDRLIQVITNLLSNAMKFSPSGGLVKVQVSRTGRKVRVEVIDQGPGIPEEFRSRIFQKFSQADSSDTRQKGGSGLGLNISRGLIEQMKGTLGFTSETGVGTNFFFELPEFRDAAPPPARTPVARAPLARSADTAAKGRILVCEDDADVAQLIGMMLTNHGYETDIVHSGEEALAAVQQKNYKAVTVDLKLPGQTGAALIAALRRDEKTRSLPVVVVSGLAGEGKRLFDRKPPTVSDWLEKPIDEAKLLSSLKRALAPAPSDKPRVLHVEDDPDVQSITAAIAGDDAVFEFASTLQEAQACLRQQTYDLILLDLTLGENSGWSLFDDIDILNPRPPVIVFSASDADPYYSHFADAILVKGQTSNSELLRTIQQVLQISGDPGPTRPQELI